MPESVHWGPDNPHPLSKMKTEPVWVGKYDEYGNRRPVDIAASAMQKIETVDMPDAGPWPGAAVDAIAESWFAPQAFSGNR